MPLLFRNKAHFVKITQRCQLGKPTLFK